MAAAVETVDTGSRRISCARMRSDTWCLLIVNVYMPYEDEAASSDEFMAQLSNIEYLINKHINCDVITGGDLNVDISRRCLYTYLLTNFCERLILNPTVRHANYRVAYSYNFNMDRFNNWITSSYQDVYST